MRADKKSPLKSDKKTPARSHKRGVVGYSKKTALLEEAITQMNAGKYGRSSAALKELLALDPLNMEARRLFATLHLRLGSLIPARQAFDSLIHEAFERQDYWLAESLLREYLAAGPRCVPFIEKLGSVYQEKGDALEAVAEYGKAIDILIEDPDPDNPQHAAQLYAKIRELAPASPIAFRLAAFFDAQTGELIARSHVAQTEPAAAVSQPPVAESLASDAAVPEPMAGVMPWEQGIEEPPALFSAPPIAEPPSLAAEETLVSAPVADRTDHSVNGSMVLEQPPVEPVAAHESPAVEAGLAAAEAFFISNTDQTQPAETIIGSFNGAVPSPVSPSASSWDVPQSASAAVSAVEPEAQTIPIIPTDVVASEPPVRQESEGPAAEISSVTGEEPISAPMPWEDVQESTITILEPVSNDPPPLTIQSDERAAATLSEPASQAAVEEAVREGAESAPPAPITAESGHAVQETEAPTALLSSVEATPVSALPDLLKGGGFSWESIFSSAWKFGDKVSANTPLQEAAQADGVQTGESSDPMMPSSDVSAPAPAEIVSAEQANPPVDTMAPAVSVAQPMPWDQVQETIVTIPPAPVDDTAADNAGSETSQSPSPVESTSQPPAAASSPSRAPHIESFSISQPPPAPPTSQPEFRLIGTHTATPIDAPSFSSPEESSQSSELEEISEPLAPIEPEPPAFSMASGPIVESTLKSAQQGDASDFVQEEKAEIPPSQSQETAAILAPAPVTEIVSSVPQKDEPVPQFHEETPIQPASPASGGDAGTTSSHQDALSQTLKDEVGKPAFPSGVFVEEPSPHKMDASVPAGLDVATASTEVSPADESSMESSQMPSPSTGDVAPWKTGEVAIQPHRPSPKKRKKTPEPESDIPPVLLSREETVHRKAEESLRQEAAFADARARMPEPAPQQEKWIRTGESIRFIEPEPSGASAAPPHAPVQAETDATAPISTAAAAVAVLFESSGRFTKTATRERLAEPKPRPRLGAKLSRIRIAITVFLSSCFSTTRAIVTSLVALVVLSGALAALMTGAVGLAWIIMEEPPSPAFHSLTTTPQRTLSDSKKNGYLLLLGFDAPVGDDPIQAGYERKPDGQDADMAAACVGGPNSGSHGRANASASVANGWFRAADPAGQFKSHQDTIKGWINDSALARYKQWLKLSFEDWGYGQSVSPPCASILFAHQLYVADGFLQGSDTGIDRLETDMEAWRVALGQAKTLPVKTMALQAIHDDIAVASGLLVKPDFDGKMLGRMTKMLRPLDQVELSIRWPMQSELISATKTFDAQLKAERGEDPPWYAVVASALPLPKQRRFNDYAEYYEASYKAAGEGRYGSMPKWHHYIRFPASSALDYLGNPIENIIGLEPLARWDLYNGLVVDADAHFRLASLQAWLRRGPQDADLLARIAKAGQSVYDPYTGLPMLVNLKKGVMYSVGHDGKDQDADPQDDVVVAIPANQSSAVPARTGPGPSLSG